MILQHVINLENLFIVVASHLSQDLLTATGIISWRSKRA